MNREDVIRLAREAGLIDPDLGECVTDFGDATDSIHRFSALVAAAEREALKKDGPVATIFMDQHGGQQIEFITTIPVGETIRLYAIKGDR